MFRRIYSIGVPATLIDLCLCLGEHALVNKLVHRRRLIFRTDSFHRLLVQRIRSGVRSEYQPFPYQLLIYRIAQKSKCQRRILQRIVIR